MSWVNVCEYGENLVFNMHHHAPPPPTALLLSPDFNKVSHYYINLPMLLSFTCPSHARCCSFNLCHPIELLHMIKAVSIMIIPFTKKQTWTQNNGNGEKRHVTIVTREGWMERLAFWLHQCSRGVHLDPDNVVSFTGNKRPFTPQVDKSV